MKTLKLRFDYDAVGNKPKLKTSVIFRIDRWSNEVYVDFVERNGPLVQTNAFDRSELKRLHDWCNRAIRESEASDE